MSFDYSLPLNSHSASSYYPNFRAANTVAAQQSQQQIKLPIDPNNAIDTVVKKIDKEKNKKENRTAIAVGSGVVGLSVLVALFNPKYSSKIIKKLKVLKHNANSKFEKAKKNTVESKFYKTVSKGVDWTSRFIAFTNNFNSVKDTYFKKICTEEKTFGNIKNLKTRKFLTRFDNAFRRIMKKPHEAITNWGDKLAKHTVQREYAKSVKRMNKLEEIIQEYTKKLPSDKAAQVNEKLAEITKQREYFSNNNLEARFKHQGELLSNLNQDIRTFFNQYRKGFTNKSNKKADYFNKNMYFWAQDKTEPTRKLLNEEGKVAVDKLFGDTVTGTKGSYNEIVNILSSNLSAEEANILKKSLSKSEKAIREANKSECSKYFEKKRDLILGSAPTDILTAVAGLGVGGLALATAENKDDRISRTLTGILPTVAGIGTSIALTSMLFSGIKGMLIGFGASGVLSLMGSGADKMRKSIKRDITAKNKNTETEVQNV